VASDQYEPAELTARHEALLAELRSRSTGTPSSRPRRRWRAVARRAVLTAVAFSVLLGGSAVAATGYEYHHLNSNIKRVNVLQKNDVSIRNASEQLNAANFLIIGSDSRAGDQAQYGADVDGQRSDTTMLIHLSPDRTRAIGISVPRDSWVDIPACTTSAGKTLPEHMGMFNSAITDGGPACTIATVQKLTGIEVTHYVDVDFDGFKAMVNALGTVTVCSPEAVKDPLSGLKLIKGNNQLDGDQALAYVRARETLGDGSDLGRIKRQQRFLGDVLRQALSGSLLSNPVKLTSFLEAATKAITLDSGTSFSDLQTLTSSLHGLDPSNVVFYTAPIENANYTPPGTTMTGRVLLDPVAGRVLYDDVINDASLTVQTQISVSNSATTVTTETPAATPSGTATTSAPSTSASATVTLPAGISGSDQSCTL
jgi:LCP family protein required for cell wall assembly